ncbi:hypothetical protein RND71_029467 [Anisodus tanguticus]|uniref:Uncharacterized protein n=1 Tax=Anisodus tanguticus TaxID=243964 RepID=A0AAE1V6B5_9SOLA|nr:hypothetical protein RND71_029467 [Anisodus tanguticus]
MILLNRLGGRCRRKKLKVMDDWWHKMVFPVRRVWFAVSARVKARKNVTGFDGAVSGWELGGVVVKMEGEYAHEVMGLSRGNNQGAGLLKLRDDIQTCGYEDVQVMWEMLRKNESEVTPRHHKRKRRPLWRIFVWSTHSANSSFSSEHAHQ